MTARRLASVVIVGWIGVQVVAVLRAALPLPPPWAGVLPWEMFRAPPAVGVSVRVEARDAGGAWREVALDRWFRYTRGWTGERVIDDHPVFVDRRAVGAQEAFARWVLARLAEEGSAPAELRLIRVSHDVRSGRVRERELGRYAP